MTPERRAAAVKLCAAELGFIGCGITDLSPPPHGDAVEQWLRAGMAGTMGYMQRQAVKRLEPARILPGADRAVMVIRNYYNSDAESDGTRGLVAKYARGRDYHRALRDPLERLARKIEELGSDGTRTKSFIDAGPVPERELAQRAGLGWIGKNTMLINPRLGSFFFIAAVLTNADLALDLPFEADRCGSCRRCLDACPTDAFPQDRVLDSRRCISYLTIEYRGAIDPDLAARMDRWVFGCDVCQDVCPWNSKFALDASDGDLDLDPSLGNLDLAELTSISAEEFDRQYGWTPLERPGCAGTRRNAEIALSNIQREG